MTNSASLRQQVLRDSDGDDGDLQCLLRGVIAWVVHGGEAKKDVLGLFGEGASLRRLPWGN